MIYQDIDDVLVMISQDIGAVNADDFRDIGRDIGAVHRDIAC